MAKKKKKKKKAKSRKLKKSKGNFRRPTPAVAKTYLARREKQGVVNAADIVLEDKKEQEIQRTRWREANNVWNDYQRRVEAHEVALAAYKAAKKSKADGHEMLTRPSKPSLKSRTKDAGRRGNFKRMSKKQAKAYLVRVFRNHAGSRAATPENIISRGFNVNWDYKVNQRIPRLQEAILIAGIDEALKVLNKQKKNFVKAQGKALEKAQAAAKAKKTRAVNKKKKDKKRDKANAQRQKTRKKNRLAQLDKEFAKIDKMVEKCQARGEARRKELDKQRAKIQGVTVASRRKRAKHRKARKARRARMMKKSKKMRKSRKSRKSRKAKRRRK